MDDEAASQQLVSEARATHSTGYDGTAIPLNLGGASQHAVADTPESSKKKSRKAKKSKSKHLADSQTSPGDTTHASPFPTYSLKDLQAYVGESPSKGEALPSTAPSTQIEVPDSQAANGTTPPTPTTSNEAISPDDAKSRSRSKSKRQAEADLLNGTIPATPLEEAGEGPASQKRRKKHKSQPSADSVNAGTTEISGRSVATQDVADALAYRNKQSSILDEPLTPKALLSDLTAERSQRSQSSGKPPTSAQRQRKGLEAAPGDVDAEAEAEVPDATDALTAANTPSVNQDVSKKKKKEKSKNDKKVTEAPKLNWEAPVRSLDDTSGQPFTFEDSDGGATEATDSQRKKKKKKKKSTNDAKSSRYSVGGPPKTPSRKPAKHDPNKNYERARDDDDRTAADRALETTHQLGQPPDKRTGGDWTADERELLRRAIKDYQERNGLDTADLVEIIQWSNARKISAGGDTTDQAGTELKKESDAFWEEVQSAGLLRRMKEIKKHVRTNYHTCQRGPWSTDEDEQLRELVDLHPGEWKLIATQLNRLELDAYNRWNDYLQYGENRVTKRWSLDEEEKFVKVLSTVCQRIEDYRAETGQPPLEDYIPVINWHEVCKEMGNTRSRLQCQYKLRQMTARVPPPNLDIEIKPRQTPPPGEMGVKLESLRKHRRTPGAKKRKSAVAEADVEPPGPDDMLWGDKFDLVGCLIEMAFEGGVDTEDQIVWHDVAEKMYQARMVRWTVPTLQTTYKELCELVLGAEEEEDNLQARVTTIYSFMKNNHFSELEDFYQPKHDGNGEDAPHANSSKKRKRQSGAGSAKKRNKKAPDITKFFKSKELITESDNAESEPEL